MTYLITCDWCGERIKADMDRAEFAIHVERQSVPGELDRKWAREVKPARFFCVTSPSREEKNRMGLPLDSFESAADCYERAIAAIVGIATDRPDAGLEWRLVEVDPDRGERTRKDVLVRRASAKAEAYHQTIEERKAGEQGGRRPGRHRATDASPVDHLGAVQPHDHRAGSHERRGAAGSQPDRRWPRAGDPRGDRALPRHGAEPAAGQGRALMPLVPVGDVSAPSEDEVLADVLKALERALNRLPADSDWTSCLRTVCGALRVRLGLRGLRSVSESDYMP